MSTTIASPTAPDFADRERRLKGAIRDAQEVLARHLPPGGLSADETIAELLFILDDVEILRLVE